VANLAGASITGTSLESGTSSFEDLVLERAAFRGVFLEPDFRNLCGCEHLDVLDIADLLAGVDVDKEGHIGPSPNPKKFSVSFE
jgi:hypothetical protein